MLKFIGNDPTTGYPRTILEAMANQFLLGIFLSIQYIFLFIQVGIIRRADQIRKFPLERECNAIL